MGKSPRFVVGYPQNQDEATQSRAIIYGHAASRRWRKSDISRQGVSGTTVRSRQFTERRRFVTQQYPELRFQTPDKSQNRFRPISDWFEIRRPSHWLNPTQTPPAAFSHSLQCATLPPPLPVERQDVLSHGEVWVVLGKIKDALEQAFPEDFNGTNRLAMIWMEQTISSAEVLSAQIFGQLVRDEYLGTPACAQRRRRLAICYYLDTLKRINKNMQTVESACSTSNMLAIFILAHHQPIEEDKPPASDEVRPCQGPLNSLRLLNLYGGPISFVSIHAEGLERIIELNGGLQALTMPGLLSQMSYAETISATRELHSPGIEFVPCLKIDFDDQLSAQRRIDHPLRQMGYGFDILGDCSSSKATSELRLTLRRLALYSLAVDDYVTGRPFREALSIIGELRNFVQHNLMSLMSAQKDANLDVYNFMCLRAAVIYSLLSVFPILAAPFDTLVRQIKSCLLDRCSAEEWEKAPRLMTWIICMVSVASEGTPEQASFLNILERCLGRLEVRSWEALKELLQSFLWLPTTNDADGIVLWQRIANSNPLSLWA